MIATHACLGAECPHCSPWALKTKQDSAKIATFRDSRGLAVQAMPSVVKVGTCAVIIPMDFYASIPFFSQIEKREAFSKIPWPLLVHQRSDNGFWGFVGGAMDPGESLSECLEREVLEETGLHIWKNKLCCIDSDPCQFSICQYNDGNIVHYCNFTFLCIVQHPNRCRISSESESMMMVYSNNLPEPFLPLHKWRLTQVIENFYSPSIPYR